MEEKVVHSTPTREKCLNLISQNSFNASRWLLRAGVYFELVVYCSSAVKLAPYSIIAAAAADDTEKLMQ